MMEENQVPKPQKKRKTSLPPNRGSRAKHRRPNCSKRLKELWQDPEWRARTIANQTKGGRGNRIGVPDGMRKAEATERWEEAEESAKKTMAELKNANLLGECNEKAEEALEAALVIMRGPGTDKKLKLAAARLVLDFTKSKPASKAVLAIDEAEQWLKMIADESNDRDKGEAASDA